MIAPAQSVGHLGEGDHFHTIRCGENSDISGSSHGLLIIPDPIAVSTGYNPTSFPIKAEASPIARTDVKLRRMNCQVIALARVERSIKERPIPARTAWVRLVIMTWLNMTTQFSKGFGTALKAFRIKTMIIMKA